MSKKSSETKCQRIPPDVYYHVISKKKYKRESFGDILRRILKLKETDK